MNVIDFQIGQLLIANVERDSFGRYCIELFECKNHGLKRGEVTGVPHGTEPIAVLRFTDAKVANKVRRAMFDE